MNILDAFVFRGKLEEYSLYRVLLIEITHQIWADLFYIPLLPTVSGVCRPQSEDLSRFSFTFAILSPLIGRNTVAVRPLSSSNFRSISHFVPSHHAHRVEFFVPFPTVKSASQSVKNSLRY